jgi:hypothetical protein
MRQSALADPSGRPRLDAIWRDILIVGGSVWVVVTIIEVLWFWPVSGRVGSDGTVLTSGVRSAAQVLEFSIAAIAIRIAVAYGWPETAPRRFEAAAVNLLLAATVLWMRILFFRVAALGMPGQAHDSALNALRMWWRSEWMDWVVGLRLTLPTYVLALALIALYRTARRYHDESLRVAQLVARYSQVQLAMLSAQLQPHFLFNSLNLIAELVASRPTQATVMIARLGDYLRHALEASREPWVTVSSELAGLRAYLAVQEVRYEDRLTVQARADEDTTFLYLPSMLLQPLVENAIEHGRRGPEPRLHVHIQVRRENGRIVVDVVNSTPRVDRQVEPAQYREGLRNVSQRLLAAYQGAAALSIGPNHGAGTLARMVLPLIDAPPALKA